MGLFVFSLHISTFVNVGEEKKIPPSSHSLSSSGWSNNQIDMRQINRRKIPKFNYICMYRCFIRILAQLKLCLFELRLRGQGLVVWDFKEKKGSSCGMEKQMFPKQMFAGPSLTMAQRGLWSKGSC